MTKNKSKNPGKPLSAAAAVLFAILILTFTLSAVSYDPIPDNGTTLKEILDITAATKNIVGEGFRWDNRRNTLYLSGVIINTDDQYGLKLPGDVTVEITGKNIIRGSRAAVCCVGNASFSGDGTLTLISDTGSGIYCSSLLATDIVNVSGGSLIFRCGGAGLLSEYASFICRNSSYDFSCEGSASSVRSLQFSDCTLASDAAFDASYSLIVSTCRADVEADSAAFSCPGTLSVLNMKSGGQAFEYTGETAVHLTPGKRPARTSIIFGDQVPGFVDFIAGGALLALLAAFAVIPAVKLHRKNAEMRKKYGFDEKK